MEAVKKEKDELIRTSLTKLGVSGAALAAEYIHPGLSVVVSAAGMLVNGEVDSVEGLDALAESEKGKAGIKAGNITAAAALNFILDFNRLEKEIKAKERKMLLEWFGYGIEREKTEIQPKRWGEGKMETNIELYMAGLYDPKAIATLWVLEEKGLGGLAGWDQPAIDNLVDNIKKLNGSDEKKMDACTKIIEGGYSVVDENGRLNADFNMGEFQEAIRSIEKGIQNTRGVELPDGGTIRENFFRN